MSSAPVPPRWRATRCSTCRLCSPASSRDGAAPKVTEVWEQPARPRARGRNSGRQPRVPPEIRLRDRDRGRGRPARYRFDKAVRNACSTVSWSAREASRLRALETVSVEVPQAALEAYEAALASVCATVGLFREEATGLWRVEGVKRARRGRAGNGGRPRARGAVTGERDSRRAPTPPKAGSLVPRPPSPSSHRPALRRARHPSEGAAGGHGRISSMLDAGLAFGSGEHGSTRGCLRALERIAHRRPRRILDLGTGSGILAMAAARLLRRRVLATDIDPWSVRVDDAKRRLNGVAPAVGRGLRMAGAMRTAAGRAVRSGVRQHPRPAALPDGARPGGASRARGRRDPGGAAGLSGADGACRPPARGLRLDFIVREGSWTTLVLRAVSRPRAGSRLFAPSSGVMGLQGFIVPRADDIWASMSPPAPSVWPG